MGKERTAQIIGGGLAGLTAATLLARSGWSVVLHERSTEIREVGAGIYLKNNLIAVLELLGIADQVRSDGVVLERSQMRNGGGVILQDHQLSGIRRTWMSSRNTLIRALAGAAADAGVDIRLGSKVISAEGDGAIKEKDGTVERADVVIAADGVSSMIRQALGLTTQYDRLSSVATRYLIPSREAWPMPITAMHWSGRRRIGVSAVSQDDTYVYMIAPSDDADGIRLPCDFASWNSAFPALGGVLDEIRHHDIEAFQHQYNIVHCRRWSEGRVALVGDAAHGQPPLLGQGGALAMSNAARLAQRLVADGGTSVPQTLARWEAEVRPVTEATQRWSVRMNTITDSWPRSLRPLRAPLLRLMGRETIQKRMRAAEAFDVRIR